MPDRLEHPPHLALAAFVDRKLDPRGAEAANGGACRAAVLELHSAGERPQRGFGGTALHFGDVDLVDLVARMRQPVGERTVVSQQERARRVGVEAADRDDPSRMADEVDDGRPAVRVARGRDDARGLVQQDVCRLLRPDADAVHLHHVPPAHVRIQLPGSAVDSDAPGLDQLVGAPARGDPGAREIRVQPHVGIIRGH
jgi:hypothetical protein